MMFYDDDPEHGPESFATCLEQMKANCMKSNESDSNKSENVSESSDKLSIVKVKFG